MIVRLIIVNDTGGTEAHRWDSLRSGWLHQVESGAFIILLANVGAERAIAPLNRVFEFVKFPSAIRAAMLSLVFVMAMRGRNFC